MVGTRVGWVRRGGLTAEYAWSEAGAATARGVARDAERPAVPVVHAPDARSPVSAADHLVLRTPDGDEIRLDG